MWTDIIIFYGGGAAIFGAFAGTMETVTFTYRGRDVPCPRLAIGILAGAIWPWTFWQIVSSTWRDE